MKNASGRTVALLAILKRIPANTLVWHLLHITGIGNAPLDKPMPEFEDDVRESENGYRMTWTELLTFASRMEQVWDCLIVGAASETTCQRDRVEASDFTGCDYVIEGLDSTEWKVCGDLTPPQSN